MHDLGVRLPRTLRILDKPHSFSPFKHYFWVSLSFPAFLYDDYAVKCKHTMPLALLFSIELVSVLNSCVICRTSNMLLMLFSVFIRVFLYFLLRSLDL